MPRNNDAEFGRMTLKMTLKAANISDQLGYDALAKGTSLLPVSPKRPSGGVPGIPVRKKGLPVGERGDPFDGDGREPASKTSAP